ncbi:MAG: hypothetical protein Q9157_000063 [Trypethelium eluteriae]
MSAFPNLPESVAHAVISDPGEAKPNGATKLKENGVTGGEDTAVPNALAQNAEPQIRGSSQNGSWKLHDVAVENHRPMKASEEHGMRIDTLGVRAMCLVSIPDEDDSISQPFADHSETKAHSYQYSFDPNPAWSSLYAPSHEIRTYLDRVARKYSVDRFTKFRHEIVSCVYDEDEGKWHVRVKDHTTGLEFEDVSDVLISARGNLNNISWPNIEGLRDFKGEIMHSAQWNESYDFTNKRIGIIGSGSSAIQIIPNLQRVPGAQLTCFIRSRTWISPPFAESLFKDLGLSDFNIPPSRIQQFLDDPSNYHAFRMLVEEDGNNIHGVTIKGTPIQLEGQKLFEQGMRERLAPKPEIYDKLIPSFSPGCRRLTPGPGFLEALCQDNVLFAADDIARIEPEGVRTADEKLHEIDVLVCATGFHVSAPPPFPVAGSGGKTIREHWSKRASTYLSLATDAFPNHFIMLGPNAAIGSGSLTMMIESVGDYIVKCVRKLQKENLKSISIKPERVEDFVEYADQYFEKTVFKDECRSWYKTAIEEVDEKGNKVLRKVVTGLWPGSTLHCIEALRSPRWEDYDYEYLPEQDDEDARNGVLATVGGSKKSRVNAMGWLGNGWSQNQLEQRHMAWYLEPRFLDPVRPSAPRPEENPEFAARAFSH